MSPRLFQPNINKFLLFMIINSNYSFTLTTSVDGYSSKEESIDCLRNSTASKWGKKQMAFYETTLTTDDFISLALSGHSFSGLYDLSPYELYKDEYGHEIKAFYNQKKDYRKGAMKIQFKKNEYFKSSQVVYVDVDETRFGSIQDYVSTLSMKPTCVYTTFSDGLEKHQGKGDISRRFRLVYVFDTQLKAQEWTALSMAVSEMVKNDTQEEVDCCGNRITQHMNGSCGSEYYVSYSIYSIFDFPFFQYLPQQISPKSIQENLESSTSGSEEFRLDELMVKDMETLGYNEFMKKYSRLYKYFYRTEKETWESWAGVDYQETDENYLQLWFYPEKLKDGDGRRQTIANRAFQLRIINPEADINTILFNLYVFREKYIDNSDNVVSIKVLVNRAKLVFEKSDIERNLQEQKNWIERCEKIRPRFITRTKIYKEVPQSIINQITKILNQREISKYYDQGKSVKENLQVLADNGVDVSIRALYYYLDEKGIDYKRKGKRQLKKEAKNEEIERFKKLYDPSLSDRENAKVMSASGLNISKDTVRRWKKEHISIIPEMENLGQSENIFSFNNYWEPPKFNFGF